MWSNLCKVSHPLTSLLLCAPLQRVNISLNSARVIIFPPCIYYNNCYNCDMKGSISYKRILQYIFFIFLCIVNFSNFIIVAYEIPLFFAIFILCLPHLPSFITVLSFYTFGFLYLLSGIVAIIASKKLLDNKPLSKLQKFCLILFPIITIPLYFFIIYKSFIQYH